MVTLPSKGLQNSSTCHRSHAGVQAIGLGETLHTADLSSALPASSRALLPPQPPLIPRPHPSVLRLPELLPAAPPFPASSSGTRSPRPRMRSGSFFPESELAVISFGVSLRLGPAWPTVTVLESLLRPSAWHSPGCGYSVERQGYHAATYRLISVTGGAFCRCVSWWPSPAAQGASLLPL